MNFPKYISPSSYMLFQQNREKYFVKYMSGIPQENIQTEAMSVGSAFDCFVKDSFMKDLGLGEYDEFEQQVDEKLWDFARAAGMRCFELYKDCGAYDELLELLEKSIVTPRFEFKLTREVDGVPIKGYPDVFFMTPDQLPVIHDFKVNGYCSARGEKPKGTAIKTWPPMKVRKPVQRFKYRGVVVGDTYFESVKKDWATQLTMYAWMLGYIDDFVVGIEQLAWRDDNMIVGRHQAKVGEKFREDLLVGIKDMWSVVQSGVVCENQASILKNADNPLYRKLMS